MAASQTGHASGYKLYRSFFDDATFSDLNIGLSDRTVRAHKIVLCLQSEYFSKLFASQFKDSGPKELHLEDHDPESMIALLRHIYHLPYYEFLANEASLLRPHAMVYIVADKYQVESLKLAASINMEGIIDAHKHLRGDAARPFIDDFLEALRIIVTGTTTSDQLARKVMVEGCVTKLESMQKHPALLSLLEESTDLCSEIIGHLDLESGMSGA